MSFKNIFYNISDDLSLNGLQLKVTALINIIWIKHIEFHMFFFRTFKNTYFFCFILYKNKIQVFIVLFSYRIKFLIHKNIKLLY